MNEYQRKRRLAGIHSLETIWQLRSSSVRHQTNNSVLYGISGVGQKVWMYDPATGELVKEVSLSGYDLEGTSFHPKAHPNGHIYIASSGGQKTYIVKADQDLNIVKRVNYNQPTGGLGIALDIAYFADPVELFTISPTDLSLKDNIATDVNGAVRIHLTEDGTAYRTGYIYNSGYTYYLERFVGAAEYSVEVPNQLTALGTYNGMFYVLDHSGSMIGIQAWTGDTIVNQNSGFCSFSETPMWINSLGNIYTLNSPTLYKRTSLLDPTVLQTVTLPTSRPKASLVETLDHAVYTYDNETNEIIKVSKDGDVTTWAGPDVNTYYDFILFTNAPYPGPFPDAWKG